MNTHPAQAETVVRVERSLLRTRLLCCPREVVMTNAMAKNDNNVPPRTLSRELDAWARKHKRPRAR